MIVQQVTPKPRFARGIDRELCLQTKLAVVIYAENAEEEIRIRKIIDELVR